MVQNLVANDSYTKLNDRIQGKFNLENVVLKINSTSVERDVKSFDIDNEYNYTDVSINRNEIELAVDGVTYDDVIPNLVLNDTYTELNRIKRN